MIWSQLRRRRGRALGLAAGILVAATSFTLLTSTVTTSQAHTTGLARRNARSAYDILVRPPGAVTDVERQRGLLQANFLSGVFGGITLDQYKRIRRMAGVDVAAPVANIGYLMVDSSVTIDVSAFLDSAAPAQILRIRPTVTAGLSSSYQGASQYLYLTRAPITTHHRDAADLSVWDGLQTQRANGRTYDVCWFYNDDRTGLDHNGDGTPLTPSPESEDLRDMSALDPDLNSAMTCRSGQQKATVTVPVSFPVLLSAVDPAAEDRLVGLGGAVTSGRMLTGRDTAVWGAGDDDGAPGFQVPVLLSAQPLTAGSMDADVERLTVGDPAALPARLGSPGAHDYVNGLAGTPVGTVGADLAGAFTYLPSAGSVDTEDYWTVGPVRYRVTKGGGLTVLQQPPQRPDLWRTNVNDQPVQAVPEENRGPQYRAVTAHPSTFCWTGQVCDGYDAGRGPIPHLRLVGRYDTGKLRGFDALSDVPLETYRAPRATGADAATRIALHDGPLLPDRNLGGYLSPPPTLLTTLDAASALTHSRRVPTAQEKAPVSAIRVRVAGVKGVDAGSRARVNAVVAQIHSAYPTLDVEVTVGASPAPQTVTLPSGFRITEAWTAKGVALRILTAVDKKSAILFVLVLVVCGLFIGQAALASVRSRRTEIGTLRCLGWSAPEVLALILGELTVIGLGAGALGAGVAYLLGSLLGLGDAGTKAALVLPVALLLAVAAGLLPAWRATRMGPLDAVTAPVTAVRRTIPVRSVAGLALVNLLRMRGRTLLGAAGLALGVAAFTLLLALTLAFRGEVAGTLLGNAVIAQARTADYLSVALSLLLGAAGAVDVLVLAQRERAADLAVLRATGWTTGELARLTLYEGVGIALLGGLTGAAVGLTAVLTIGQGLLHGRLLAVTGAALLATAAAVLLVCATLALPIRARSRRPPAQLLAAD
ncbi:FtsX-like permease family protein [Actinacidiphila alni]|uniref:FtsX-like permease family protein n=1 Tax=Actinacidiphila alni TaxID=380248 RepID=A0A1I2GIS7_9ACTN|nr:ABC transporter permease [Actinacidiphila alni]SFF17128.1 FtsX-like permease family protein [Actinacidiphila alni]